MCPFSLHLVSFCSIGSSALGHDCDISCAGFMYCVVGIYWEGQSVAFMMYVKVTQESEHHTMKLLGWALTRVNGHGVFL